MANTAPNSVPTTPKSLEEAPPPSVVQAPPGSRFTRFLRTLGKVFWQNDDGDSAIEEHPLVARTDPAAADIEPEETGSETYTPAENEAACANMWSVYVREAERYDKGLVESWKGDMDGILIFSGLFSAALTTFLIESYKTLQPDSGDRTVELLVHISQQLASSSAGASPFPIAGPPTIAALFCNILWFCSLALSLTCSLLATLVQQWSRDFLHTTEMHPAPVIRARVFSYLYFGLKRFRMHAVVDTIPMFLHVSLLLFFGGLIAFLLPVNRVLVYLMAVVLAMFTGIYLYFTVLPMISFDSPFHTPLSKLSWSLWQWYSNLKQPRDQGAQASILSLAETVVQQSKVTGVDRDKRDDEAVVWTVKSLTDDTELLPFVEAISDVVYGAKGLRLENKHLLFHILYTDDSQTSIVRRITDLMHDTESPWVDEKLRSRRQNACWKALWSLGFMIITDSGKSLSLDNWQRFEFGSDTIKELMSIEVKNGDTHSATTVLRFIRLKMLEMSLRQITNECDMTSEPSQMQTLESVRDMLAQVPDDVVPQIPYDPLRRLKRSLPDNAHTQEVLETLSSDSYWAGKQIIILADYLGASLRAQSCPYEFFVTCKAIWPSMTSIDDDGLKRYLRRNLFSYIPGPSADAALQTTDIHDVDRLVMVSLRLLPYAHDLAGFYVSRYITSRNHDDAVEYILQDCNMNHFTATLIEGEIYEDSALTIGTLLRLGDIPNWQESDKWTLANQVFSRLDPLEPDPLEPDHRPALSIVHWVILGELYSRMSDTPDMDPPSWNELKAINEHPLLSRHFEPIELPADVSESTFDSMRNTLKTRHREVHISVLSGFLAICTTLPPYHAAQTAMTICDSNLRIYEGQVRPETQLTFADHVLSLTEALAEKPENTHLDEILQGVWYASWEWQWITDTDSASTLESAMNLYQNNDGMKTEKKERHECTQRLFDRCEAVLTPLRQPSTPQPQAAGLTSGRSTADHESHPTENMLGASATQSDLSDKKCCQ